jgi:hypothetical protein
LFALWAVVWGAVVVLVFVFGDSDVAFGVMFGGPGGLLGVVLVARYLLPRRTRRYARRNRVECGLRVVEGQQPGLGRRWRHGTGTLAPGRLVFRGAIGGVRFLRRAPILVEITHVDRSRRRAVGWREAWWAWPGTEVVEAVTPTARLEWGVPGPVMQWAMDQLHPPRGDSGATSPAEVDA